jgi:beta-glucosidase
LATLSEVSGIEGAGSSSGDVFFSDGRVATPWSLYGIVDGNQTRMNGIIWDGGKLAYSGTDRTAQEDALRIDWREGGQIVRFATHDPVDLSRQSNGAMELSFYVRNFNVDPAVLTLSMGCDAGQCGNGQSVRVNGQEWQEIRISLSCFADQGADLSNLQTGLAIFSASAASIGISEIRLLPDTDATKTCGI